MPRKYQTQCAVAASQTSALATFGTFLKTAEAGEEACRVC